DEADTLTYWDLPEGAIRAGANELRIHCAGSGPDDVLIGEVALVHGSREQVLSAATIAVSVRQEPDGRAVPARVTVTNADGTLMSTGNESSPDLAVRPGVLYTRMGDARLQLPAGRYVIHAGRGFEYSVARAEIDLRAGTNPPRQLVIRREVDTAGWAAMDTHVHTGTFARHGDAAIRERMLTLAGEGVELPVSTEHNTRVDFEPAAREARVDDHFTPLVGSEVTTPALGHFNVFPLPPTAVPINAKAPDWPRLQASISGAADDPVIVLNHGRDLHGGFRPLDAARHVSIAGENLDGWVLPANAMEVVNSGAVMSDALALPRDWMGLLNRGLRITPIGSSDSHDVSRYIVGQGRTYVRVNDTTPGRIDRTLAAARVRGGQVTVSYGLLTEIEVNGRGPGEIAAEGGDLDVRVGVKGPAWSRADRVALYVNGEEVRRTNVSSGAKAGLKWQAAWRMARPAHDVHVVAIAMGPGIAAPYWPTAKPYQPTSIEFTPYVLGLTGAVFVDGDGNGRFDSALEYARREVEAAGSDEALLARLATYDTAVAIQAASLLRAADPKRFEARLQAMMARAALHVRRGLDAYLREWRNGR
ncbi:MAG TPA: CehA/McbA family metallohydrolase, partial [Vicinamibacterales bacterium]|nr:CehA/McbA family metallohydrolase [Vicinamibacterales bacterium]